MRRERAPDDQRRLRPRHSPTPFLTDLISQVLAGHDHNQVFTGAHGGYLRRSNFNRRTWTPAANGNPNRSLPPVIDGMHLHDLRHTHKTWLIEDDIPEIAQAKQLGHRLHGVYSHATPAMHQRLTRALQARWETNQSTSRHQPTSDGYDQPHNPNRRRAAQARRPVGIVIANDTRARLNHSRRQQGHVPPSSRRRADQRPLSICSPCKQQQTERPLPKSR